MPLEVGGGLSRSERLARVRAIMARVKTSAVAGINAALMKLFIALGTVVFSVEDAPHTLRTSPFGPVFH